MAQLAQHVTNEFESKEGKNDNGDVNGTDLKTHLSKFSVSSRVFSLLQKQSISMDELTTFTNQDLVDWSNEQNLKIIERRRFINAVKSLKQHKQSNNNNNNNNTNEVKIVRVFLGNEEKEQLSKFDEMEKNINQMIDVTNDINNKKNNNVNNLIEEVNSVCDEMQSFVDSLRKDLLTQFKLRYT